MPRTFKVFHRVILLAWAAPEGGAVARGATTAEKLRGSRFGSQHRGACTPRPVKGRPGCLVREGVAPFRCEGPGMSPRKIFENSDVKSCILVTLAVKYLAFWKLRPRSWGDQYIVGPPTVGDQSPAVPTVVAPIAGVAALYALPVALIYPYITFGNCGGSLMRKRRAHQIRLYNIGLILILI